MKTNTQPWRRYRFHADLDDYRPVKWPALGPYWCSGEGDGYSIIVAYLPTDADIQEFWPEASKIDMTEEEEIVFSDRFSRPEWWKGEGRNV